MRAARLLATATAILAVLVLAPAAGASGVASPGFAVSDFATGFPTGARFGPLGVAFDARGTLFAIDNTDSNLYSFSAAGGTASGPSLVSTTPIPGYLLGLAFDESGELFVAREAVNGSGDVAQIDPTTGAVLRVVASGLNPLGLATDPVSGDLFVTEASGPLTRIANPGSQTPNVSNYGEALSTPDGIVFGPDGTIYVEDAGNIVAITGTAAANPGVNTTVGFVSEADGIAVAETTNSTEPPFLAVSSNDGTMTKVGLGTSPVSYAPMVTGGSRGDFLAVGPDRCLYATQIDSIEKVTAADGTCPFYPSSPFHCSTAMASVSPATGQVAIGTQPASTVTISGRSFCAGTKVQFGNGTAVVSATVQSATQLSATVPASATTGELKLIDPYGNTGVGSRYVINNYRDNEGLQFLNDLGVGLDVTWSDVAAAYGSNAYQQWSLCGGCKTIQVPSIEALEIYANLLKGELNGLCFGFSLGSLKLSQGVDKLAANSDPARSDPQWNQPTVWDLPPFETSTDPYGTQMRHYLYQQSIRQFSTETYDLNTSYLDGLKSYSDQSHLGAYVENQVRSAFSHGLPIMEIFIRHGGHALVGYSMQSHPDGGFDINVYDPDDPFQSTENRDVIAHDFKLVADQIHVKPDGSWSYTGGLGSTWSGPARDMRTLAFASQSGTLHPLDTVRGYVATRGPIRQIVDRQGMGLYDAQGNLVADSQRPTDVNLLNPITGTASTVVAASTGLVLNASGHYTETVGAGTLNITGSNLDGQVTSGGGKVNLDAAGQRVQLLPAAVGSVTLQLTHHEGAVRTTVTISGRLGGPIALDDGAANTTVTAAKPATLTVSVTREGLGQPPQTLQSAIRLGSGQRLELGALRRIDLTASRLRAILNSRGHARVLMLVNRASRPIVRIVRASAKRGRSGTRIVVRLATGGAHGGQVVVTARGGGHSVATVQLAAQSEVTASLQLSAQRHGQRVRVWAVVLTRGGQAGRIATGAILVR